MKGFISLLLILTSISNASAGFIGVTHRKLFTPSASFTLVNKNAWNSTVVSEAYTRSLGWTVTAGNFLMVLVIMQPGGTCTGVNAKLSSTSYPMTNAISFTTGRTPVYMYYLPNAAAVTSVVGSFSSSNGSALSLMAAEYSGLSSTASIVNTAQTSDSGFVDTSTWSTPSYTAAAGSLLLAGCASNLTGGTWGAGTGWTLAKSYSTGESVMLEHQFNVSATSYTGTGTISLNNQYMDCFIIAFK
jgi:hypothetical protein